MYFPAGQHAADRGGPHPVECEDAPDQGLARVPPSVIPLRFPAWHLEDAHIQLACRRFFDPALDAAGLEG